MLILSPKIILIYDLLGIFYGHFRIWGKSPVLKMRLVKNSHPNHGLKFKGGPCFPGKNLGSILSLRNSSPLCAIKKVLGGNFCYIFPDLNFQSLLVQVKEEEGIYCFCKKYGQCRLWRKMFGVYHSKNRSRDCFVTKARSYFLSRTRFTIWRRWNSCHKKIRPFVRGFRALFILLQVWLFDTIHLW